MYILVYSFLIFIICSFIGYFLEVLWIFFHTHKLVNRGFLCGPIIPVYGIGALLIIFSLLHYYQDPLVIFVFGVIITSSLEYFTSFILEKIFHNKWWDYSNTKYNLNGRICLGNCLLFGLLALIIIYFFLPALRFIFSFFSFKTLSIIALVIAILFTLDLIYSIYIAYNLRNRIIIVEELKNEKIANIPIILEKKIKESIAGVKAFPNRLLKAFPNLEKQNKKFFETMRKIRQQYKEKKSSKK